jgi:hypothetical protein
VKQTWIAQTVEGQSLGELSLARDRGLSFDLRGAATAKFQMDGRMKQGWDLAELATDLLVVRGSELIFRGRLGSTDDTLDANRHMTSWSAVDYRGLLGGRIDPSGRTYEGWNQDDIGWNLVSIAQQGAGGQLGITRGGSHAAPVARAEVVDSDTPIDKVLDRFQDYENGFEYWIDPQLQYQAATWRGVEHADFPLVWGTTVTELRRSYDTGRYANWVRVRGGRPEGETEAAEFYADRAASNLASLREGRIARVVNNSELKDQGLVNAAADQLLADSLNPPAAYSVKLSPGIWGGPADCWLGDSLPLIIRSGRLNIAATARVSQLDLDTDENGIETVSLTVGVGE